MYRERGGLGERLELKLVDGRTGEVKRHLVVTNGVCVDLKSDWGLALEIQAVKGLLNEFALNELSRKTK